jgi:hypothetical protein
MTPRAGNVDTTKLVFTNAGRGSSFAAMQTGARTPEELETLLEDAFVMRDHTAAAGLFERDAVIGSSETVQARGHALIVQLTQAMVAREQLFVAGSARVLQVRRTALMAGPSATSVAHRTLDGAWRYSITLLHDHPHADRSKT